MSEKHERTRGEIVLHEECIAGQNCGPMFGQVRVAIPVIEQIEDNVTRRIKKMIWGQGPTKHLFGKGNR
jgi:hypothetical protein